MAGETIKADQSGDILVELNYDNIILVDPNKTINQGKVSERLVDHENMVMYANLEAELLPRTKLAVGASPDSIRTISIAKINFLKPTKNDYLGVGYYDELTGKNSINGTADNQTKSTYIPPSNGQRGYNRLDTMSGGESGSIDNGLLGITSINVKVSGSFIPTVSILLEDVQGKALFQQGENSPYAAFFHLPYPPFYLTLKGYYGQAIRYQLNLTKFNASFNSFGGNYQVSLEFVGYKYNILNEIDMGSLLATPHMYSSKFDISNTNNGVTPSTSLQSTVSQQDGTSQNASNSQNSVVKQIFVEKGYQKILEVYTEYKAKNLIPKNFPELTLQQLINKLDQFEQNIINEYKNKKSDVQALTDIRTYLEKLQTLYNIIYNDNSSFFAKNVNPKPFIAFDGTQYYAFKEEIKDSEEETLLSKLNGDIIAYNKVLDSNQTVGVGKDDAITNDIKIDIFTATTTPDKIDWEKTTSAQLNIANPSTTQVNELILSYKKLFKPKVVGSNGDIVNSVFNSSNSSAPFTTEVNKTPSIEIVKPFFFVIDGERRFRKIFNDMYSVANKKLGEFETKITKELKERIEDNKTGLGFTPTVRNIIAVILASAEGFIRLMDDVHTKAWDVKYDPVRKAAILDNTKSIPGSDTKFVVPNVVQNSSNETILKTPVYPWPQYFVETNDPKKGKFQLKYPGDPNEINRTQAYRYDKWPEVEFVEEFINGATKKFQQPSNVSPTTDEKYTQLININAIEFPQTDVIYANKEQIKFFYEIWERQFLSSRYENFARFQNTEFEPLLKILTEIDAKNILNSLGQSNPYLNQKLKEFKFNGKDYVKYLNTFSNNGTSESWIKFISDDFITPYIQSITQIPNEILKTNNLGKEPTTNFDKEVLSSLLKSTTTNTPIIIDIYPFTNSDWVSKNIVDADKNTNNLLYNTTKSLKIFESSNVISNFTDINEFKTNRPVTNFSYTNVQNPLILQNNFSPIGDTSFIKEFYYNRVPSNFIPTEGYCYFTTPINQNSNSFGLLTKNLPIKTTTSILNTPFFINAMINGISLEKIDNKNPYVAAAYLLLNSLPLISTREKLKNKEGGLNDLDYMFATFKKFGAIHKIPYAWILKMGSIWYRYKNVKINGQSSDILSGNIWTNTNYLDNFDPINKSPQKSYNLFLNGSSTATTIQLESVTTSGTVVQAGFFPKIIDDFNYFYTGSILYSTYSDTEIQSTIDGGLKLFNFAESNLNLSKINPPQLTPTPIVMRTWSVLLPKNDGYFVVPSWGGKQNQVYDSIVSNEVPLVNITGNNSIYNGSSRLLWSAPNYGYFDSSQIVKPNYDQYLNKIEGASDLLSPFELLNKNSFSYIEDLFSVFDKKMLDFFEEEFLKFCIPAKSANSTASDATNPSQNNIDNNIDYKNFQLLMRRLMSLRVPKTNETNQEYFTESIKEQFNTFNNIIEKFLEYDVLIKFGNPSFYDRKNFDYFLLHTMGIRTKEISSLIPTKTLLPYIAGTLPTKNGSTTYNQSVAANTAAWNSLYLNVGFSTIPELVYGNNGSYITDFFVDNNIEFSDTNIKDFAQIIKMYATQKLNDDKLTSTVFGNNLINYFVSCDKLRNDTLDRILTQIQKELPNYSETPEKTIQSRVDGQQIKIDTWEYFKSLNDKWISGSDFKTKTLFEDMLFLDKASRNIGETLYMDIFSLKNILNERSGFEKMSVYTFVASLLIENKFVVMMLPSYVNFYNVQDVDGLDRRKTETSLEFANNLWGTFMSVDYRNSGPKMVCFYVGKPSSYLALDESKNFLFRSDGIQLDKSNNLSETLEGKKDYALSNRCVGFNVDIGIRNQNIFNSFSISQDAGKGTMESVSTLYNMINQTSGRDVSTQNVSLYNLYSSRSYGCQVIGLGNALIQPTMYFNLKHVPMFNGAYMITEVNHTITPGQFQTSFTGTRQGIFDLPSLDTYLQSINKNLVTKLTELVTNKDETSSTTTTESKNKNSAKTVQTANNSNQKDFTCKPNSVYDTLGYEVTGKTATNLSQNDLIKIIKSKTGDVILQAAILSLCFRTYTGNNFNGFDNNFSFVSLRKDYRNTLNTNFAYKTYSCVLSENTTGNENSIPIINFISAERFVDFMLARLNSTQISNLGILKFYLCYWQDSTINETDYEKNKNDNTYSTLEKKINNMLVVAKENGINLGGDADINKFKYGRTYTPSPTPSATPPSPTPTPTPRPQSSQPVFTSKTDVDLVSRNFQDFTLNILPQYPNFTINENNNKMNVSIVRGNQTLQVINLSAAELQGLNIYTFRPNNFGTTGIYMDVNDLLSILQLKVNPTVNYQASGTLILYNLSVEATDRNTFYKESFSFSLRF